MLIITVNNDQIKHVLVVIIMQSSADRLLNSSDHLKLGSGMVS